MNIRPLHDYVVVRRNEAQHLSAGGIVIPDTASEKPVQGQVLAVGKGKRLKDGRCAAPAVQPGDQVLFSKYGGTEVKLDDDTLLVIHESDIMAIVDR